MSMPDVFALVDTPSEVTALPAFDLVRRGFDRHQVIKQFTEFAERVTGLTTKVAALTNQVTNERQRAEYAEQELRQAFSRISSIERANNHGFGDRMEKLMLIAEQQAADVIERAEQQAREIVEGARNESEIHRRDAEAHRREVDQALVARAATLDQEATRRSAALQRRESDIAASQIVARQQTEEMRDIVDRDAAIVRERAQAEAVELRNQIQAHAAALRVKAQAEALADRDRGARELARLVDVQGGVRAELGRINEVLVELSGVLAREIQTGGSEAMRLKAVPLTGTSGNGGATSLPRNAVRPVRNGNSTTRDSGATRDSDA
ncbi:MAG: hypothetical protein ACRDRH_03495 [Pseudonocardia sp.]